MLDHFNTELNNLKSSLYKMYELVEKQINIAIGSIETGNQNTMNELKESDLEVDMMDNLHQTLCANVLALFQPYATDLRYIMSIIMINNQLERCGDIAVNIGKRVNKIGNQKELISESQMMEMGLKANEMFKDAMNSFFNSDLNLATNVLKSDDIVDDLNKKTFKYLVEKMKSDSQFIEPCANLIVLGKNIERLADHSTNIAENNIFYLEAKIISHQKKLSKSLGEDTK